MTLQEIQTLVAAGYTKADIDGMIQPQQVAALAPQVAAPAPQVAAPAPQVAATAPQSQANDFIAALQALGAAMQQPQQQPQPTSVLPASLQPQAAQPQQVALAQPQAAQPQLNNTPSNAGITPEEAQKLFQAWSLGQATQDIELPPTAQEVLDKRFASLYGVDTSNKPVK